MKLFILLALLLITVVQAEDYVLENEAEEMALAMQEESARACTKHKMSCDQNNDECCWPWRCTCWSQTVSKWSSREVRKCQCRLW